ncbi:hypothetical protein JCM6882_001398 [Rhodosporidiobolus microsporus]
MEQNTEDKTPPLLRLPAELLDAIFELAYEDEKPSEPLCRALLPFHQSEVYRNVEVDTVRRLNLFRRVVRDEAEVRSLVKSLEVDSSNEEDLLVLPEPRNFVSLLNRLPQLRRLALQGFDAFHFDAVLANAASISLPRLRQLEVQPSRWVTLSPQTTLTSLAAFSSLHELTLRIDHFANSFFSPSVVVTMPSVQSLTLVSARPEFSTPLNIEALFPRLRNLSLSDETSWPTYREVLLRTPPTLSALTLQSAALLNGEQYPELFLTDVLGRFTQLAHLELCEDVFDPSTILPILHLLANLRHLVFGPGAPVSDNLLLSLVDPDTKPSALQRLTLNYVEAQRGDSIEDHDWSLSLQAGETDGHTYPGWEAPYWNFDSSETGLWAAQTSAWESGIEVDGTALDAIGWDNEHGLEVFWCTILWCCEQGDLDEANDLYGQNFVLESLELCFPDWWEVFRGNESEEDEVDEVDEED